MRRLIEQPFPGAEVTPWHLRLTIEKMHLEPNDVIVIRASMLSDVEVYKVRDLFEKVGIDNAVIIVTEGNDISKLSPEEMEAHGWVRK